ncbi:MAG: hypothetical protein V4496_01315 [Pseudomonadota bacterium]
MLKGSDSSSTGGKALSLFQIIENYFKDYFEIRKIVSNSHKDSKTSNLKDSLGAILQQQKQSSEQNQNKIEVALDILNRVSALEENTQQETSQIIDLIMYCIEQRAIATKEHNSTVLKPYDSKFSIALDNITETLHQHCILNDNYVQIALEKANFLKKELSLLEAKIQENKVSYQKTINQRDSEIGTIQRLAKRDRSDLENMKRHDIECAADAGDYNPDTSAAEASINKSKETEKSDIETVRNRYSIEENAIAHNLKSDNAALNNTKDHLKTFLRLFPSLQNMKMPSAPLAAVDDTEQSVAAAEAIEEDSDVVFFAEAEYANNEVVAVIVPPEQHAKLSGAPTSTTFRTGGSPQQIPTSTANTASSSSASSPAPGKMG